jgi:hypothetical protein
MVAKLILLLSLWFFKYRPHFFFSRGLQEFPWEDHRLRPVETTKRGETASGQQTSITDADCKKTLRSDHVKPGPNPNGQGAAGSRSSFECPEIRRQTLDLSPDHKPLPGEHGGESAICEAPFPIFVLGPIKVSLEVGWRTRPNRDAQTPPDLPVRIQSLKRSHSLRKKSQAPR